MLCDARQLGNKVIFFMEKHNSLIIDRLGVACRKLQSDDLFKWIIRIPDRNSIIISQNQISYFKYWKHPYKTGADSGNCVTSQKTARDLAIVLSGREPYGLASC